MLLAACCPAADADVGESVLRRGAAYLIAAQNDDGSWGRWRQPAVAALGVLGLHQCPGDADARDAAIDRAMAFVLKFADDEDGSVHGPARRRLLIFKGSSYPVYTTSLALLAMAAVDRPEYAEPMLAARAFLKTLQSPSPESTDYGGYGYDRGKGADLSNTQWVAEAMYMTADLEQESLQPDGGTAQMWQQLEKFLARTQSLAPMSPATETVTDDSHDGGFAYAPGSRLVSTGAMTYAGLKSMIYAQVDRNDRRVRGAMAFIRHNYRLDAEPVKGQQGYYYYLQTMAKALAAYGQDVIETADGPRHWRQDMVSQLAALQRDDGSWVNENGRYLESMPELVTAYALMALKAAQP